MNITETVFQGILCGEQITRSLDGYIATPIGPGIAKCLVGTVQTVAALAIGLFSFFPALWSGNARSLCELSFILLKQGCYNIGTGLLGAIPFVGCLMEKHLTIENLTIESHLPKGPENNAPKPSSQTTNSLSTTVTQKTPAALKTDASEIAFTREEACKRIYAFRKRVLELAGESNEYCITSFKDVCGNAIRLRALKDSRLAIDFSYDYYHYQLIISENGKAEYSYKLENGFALSTDTPGSPSSWRLIAPSLQSQVESSSASSKAVPDKDHPLYVLSRKDPSSCLYQPHPENQVKLYRLTNTCEMYGTLPAYANNQLLYTNYYRYYYDNGKKESLISQQEYETQKGPLAYGYEEERFPNIQTASSAFFDCFLYNFDLAEAELDSQRQTNLASEVLKTFMEYTSAVPTHMIQLKKGSLTTYDSSSTVVKESFFLKLWNKHHGRDSQYTFTWQKTATGISIKTFKVFGDRGHAETGAREIDFENRGLDGIWLRISKADSNNMTGEAHGNSYYRIETEKENVKFIPLKYTGESIQPLLTIVNQTNVSSETEKAVSFDLWRAFGMRRDVTEGIQSAETVLSDMAFCLSSIHTINKLLSDPETVVIDDLDPAGIKLSHLDGQVIDPTSEHFRNFLRNSYGKGHVWEQLTTAAGLIPHSLEVAISTERREER